MEDIFIALWVMRTLLSYLQLTALWQLKEYRFDRMKLFFSEQQGFQTLFSLPLQLSFVLLLVVAPFYIFAETPPHIVSEWFPYLYGVLLLADVLESLMDAFQRKLLRPRFTKKALMILFLSVFFSMLVLSAVLFFIPLFESKQLFLLLLLGLTALEADFHLLVVMFMNSISTFFKKKIFEKARLKRLQFPNLRVVGITGSYGKSSVKEFLSHILEGKFRVLKTQKNVNAEIGIAQTILKQLKLEHDIFICEMGAYVQGEIQMSCHIAKPQTAVFTGLNAQHQALFGSIDNTFSAKWELFNSLAPDGFSVFNGDCYELMNRLEKPTVQHRIVTTKGESSKLKDFLVSPQSFSFNYKSQLFTTPLVGGFHIQNVLMSIEIALHYGMTLPEIAERVSTLENSPRSCKISQIPDGFLIDDSYNVNPDGFEALLNHLETFEDHKKVVVFSGVLELGESSERIHKELGSALGMAADAVILTDPHFAKMMISPLRNSGVTNDSVLVSSDFEEQKVFLSSLVNKSSDQKWVIVFEGRFSRQLLEYFHEGGVFLSHMK